MNEKNIMLFCFGFVFGLLLSAAFAVGYNIQRMRLDRLAGERILEQNEQYRKQLDFGRTHIVVARREVEEGFSGLARINDSTERIREQAKILAKYYADTRNLYGESDSNPDTYLKAEGVK